MEHQPTPPPDVSQAEQLETYEIAEGPNMAELRSYLAQYGEMMVESPRMPGVVRSLFFLMNGCPKDPTEETAPEFLAEAMALVAAAEAKKQEKPEEAETDPEAESDSSEDSTESDAKKKLI
jgi:hypothetical protein